MGPLTEPENLQGPFRARQAQSVESASVSPLPRPFTTRRKGPAPQLYDRSSCRAQQPRPLFLQPRGSRRLWARGDGQSQSLWIEGRCLRLGFGSQSKWPPGWGRGGGVAKSDEQRGPGNPRSAAREGGPDRAPGPGLRREGTAPRLQGGESPGWSRAKADPGGMDPGGEPGPTAGRWICGPRGRGGSIRSPLESILEPH